MHLGLECHHRTRPCRRDDAVQLPCVACQLAPLPRLRVRALQGQKLALSLHFVAQRGIRAVWRAYELLRETCVVSGDALAPFCVLLVARERSLQRFAW